MKLLQRNIRYTIEDRTLHANVEKGYLISKRIFDIVVSSIAILLLIPLFIFIVIAIKLDSKGPGVFAQERSGYKGKLFKMYKFRSMVNDAENSLKDIERYNEVSGHMFKMKNDPRVTRVGRFIRKTSLDELPQLFNVLRGDMSIVGPRPPLVKEVLQYENWHNLRMSAKPGITGLWQISGRSRLGFHEMVRLDLKYIRERNFRYDIMIVIKTIPVLLGDRNAF